MIVKDASISKPGGPTIPASHKDEYDPFIRGEFPVGVRTVETLDPARDCLFPCEIWYPAARQHAGQDLVSENQDVYTVPGHNMQRKQLAIRNAEPWPGTFPLIIFSHHSGGHRRTATFLCTHLSSHGYVVAAMDHSEVVAPELSPRQGETAGQRSARAQAWIASRVPDVRFFLDHLLGGPAWNMETRLDSFRIGIVGHSFGAWTALAAPEVDSRIRAVVALAPGGTSNPRPGILPVKLTFQWGCEIPALYLAAENDVPLPLSGMYELFERAPEPKKMAILRRADHLHFIDNVEQEHERFRNMPVTGALAQMQKEMLPISELCSGEQAHLWVRGLTLCHMDATLKQKDEAQRFLAGDIEAELAARGVDAILHKP